MKVRNDGRCHEGYRETDRLRNPGELIGSHSLPIDEIRNKAGRSLPALLSSDGKPQAAF
jgi:hypothetical protein